MMLGPWRWKTIQNHYCPVKGECFMFQYKKKLSKIPANIRILICIAVLFATVGIIVSMLSLNFQWFARSGAMITCIGIIIISRPIIINQDLLPSIVMDEKGSKIK
jgi:hypothetical protein